MKAKHRQRKKPSWRFHLYVANTTPRSLLARANLQSLCEQYLKQGYAIRIIDIEKRPAAAIRNDILATPTLVRVAPKPSRTVIGCLSDAAAVLRGLDLRAGDSTRRSGVVHLMQEVGTA